MNYKKLLLGISAVLGVSLFVGLPYLPIGDKQTTEVEKTLNAKNDAFSEMKNDADKGNIVAFTKKFFTAEEIKMVLDANYTLMVAEKKNPPLYAMINLDKIEKITPEKKQIMKEMMTDVHLEKGLSKISDEEINKIKEVCGKTCFIVKKDESTLGVASDYKYENIKTAISNNSDDFIAQNASGIMEYLKKDYNVEMRLDMNMLNFVKGRHLTPVDVQKVVAETQKDNNKNLRILELEKGIDNVTPHDLQKMKELCGNGCIMHILDDKKISVVSVF